MSRPVTSQRGVEELHAPSSARAGGDDMRIHRDTGAKNRATAGRLPETALHHDPDDERREKMREEKIIYQDESASLRRDAFSWELRIVGEKPKYYTDLRELRAKVYGRIWSINWRTAERLVEKIDELIAQQGERGRRQAIVGAS